jgi:hypothetical protein
MPAQQIVVASIYKNKLEIVVNWLVSITQEHIVSLALNEYGTAFYLDPTHFPAQKSLLYLQLANVKNEERNCWKCGLVDYSLLR